MLRTYIFFIGTVLFVISFFLAIPPFSFPSGSIVTVPEGAGLYTLAERLREDKVIRSPLWFRVAAIVLGGERDMKAGQYLMSRPQNVFIIAWRVFHGNYDIETIKLTIPEGFTVKNISALFDDRFTFFDHADFVTQAPEGYLFPDTYFIPVTATASSTIKLLSDNFTRKISPSMSAVDSLGRTLEEIIIIASLLEAEANTKEDREMASDILWKRLNLGMPLQVDAETGTYEFVGLPENPINNPGIVSIEAAIYPTPTPYLYFLTGKDGKMHYAKTFDEHKRNIIKYLSP
ncbi:MAG: endolytic transglycosylase MltG [Patescibacteria group bacterium]|nr:endolytic transglycosylase MltG [Patescibacteria group bacterium]